MSTGLDAIPGGVLRLSENLIIESVNRGLQALVGRPAEELLGRPIDILLSGGARLLFQTHVYPALRADGRVEEVFLTLAGPDGGTIPVLFNATRAPAGSEAAYDALVVRILSRARWERELLATTRALEEERQASRQLAADLAASAEDLAARYAEEQRSRQFRDAFIGVVSHELRTPITTIYGMSHLLRQRVDRLERSVLAEHLEDLESEADRLRRLTEDLLVMSRAESGRLELAADPVLIGHVVRRAVEAAQARSAGHRFELRAAIDLPLVMGEELYVEQVVGNLLGNAAKYSAPGSRVMVWAAAEAEGIAVRVIDEGPGLEGQPPDELFKLFYRSPDARRQATGAGIGLYVCRELIRAMNGRIWAAPAKPGPGAEFGFWLPAADE